MSLLGSALRVHHVGQESLSWDVLLRATLSSSPPMLGSGHPHVTGQEAMAEQEAPWIVVLGAADDAHLLVLLVGMEKTAAPP